MRLVMTLLVRDEADIVEANVEYHLARGVDFVIATDHSSRDGTAELLRRYEREGRLLLLEAGGEAHDQVTHVNTMARAAAVDHGADWVINNDADEFWWPLVGTLKDVLSAVPEEFGALQAARSNFLPRAPESSPFFESMVVRETASRNGVGDCLEPKVVHRATPAIEMAPGNHSIEAPQVAVAPDVGLLEVLHFPIRTFEQFERKVLNVGTGYEHLEPRQPEVGRDQLALLQLQREGRLRTHFEELLLDADDPDAAAIDGELVLDTRLRDYMAGLPSAEAACDRASDEAGTRKLITEALAAAADLERARAERDLAVADRERAKHERASFEAALRTLQRSRVIRYSAPARRLYYRLRGRRAS